MKAFFRDWIKLVVGLLAFVPCLTMVIVHRMLGLSDAILAQPKPDQPFYPAYNFLMVFAFYAGIVAYFTYLLVPKRRVETRREPEVQRCDQ